MTATQYATDWRSLGACLSADPDLFFPISAAGPGLEQIARAKAICAGCQVRRQCLDFALATHQVHGVWGGTSAEDRQLLTRRRSAGDDRAVRRLTAGAGPPAERARSIPPAAPVTRQR